VPRNWGSKDANKGKNIYQGAIVRVQVPGKYAGNKASDTKRSVSVDDERRVHAVSPRRQEAKMRSMSTGDELSSERHDKKAWHAINYIDSEIHIEDNVTEAKSILRKKEKTTQEAVNYGIMRISKVSLAQVLR
jgi:hypothetical protein